MTNTWIQDHFLTWDKIKLFYRFYGVENPKNTMILLHGLGEHSGRYEKFADYLKGFSLQLAVLDWRGMGRSGGERVYVSSLEDFKKDISCFFDHLRNRFSMGEQVILFGHSFGGLMAFEWARENPQGIKSLILSSPFFSVGPWWPLKLFNSLMDRFFPHFVYQNPIYPPHLTHSKEEIKLTQKDPLMFRKASVHLLEEIFKKEHELKSTREMMLSFPVFIMMAGDERIVWAKATQRLYEKIRAPQKKLIELDGFYHEIFNETEQEKAFDILRNIIGGCV